MTHSDLHNFSPDNFHGNFLQAESLFLCLTGLGRCECLRSLEFSAVFASAAGELDAGECCVCCVEVSGLVGTVVVWGSGDVERNNISVEGIWGNSLALNLSLFSIFLIVKLPFTHFLSSLEAGFCLFTFYNFVDDK